MAALKLYPVGIQTFERIIKEDMLYVDKTEYVYHMTHTSGKHFFLGRPRRFGKSLLASTFHSYFAGKKAQRGFTVAADSACFSNMLQFWRIL